MHGAGKRGIGAVDDDDGRQKKLILAAAIAAGVVPARACAACTEAQRCEYGCEGDTDRQEHWLTLDDGDVVRRCPYAVVGVRERRVVQYAGLIESGVLPDAGGWLDQSASYTDALPAALSARRQFEQEARKHDRR